MYIRRMLYVSENAWHLRPCSFRFSTPLLPLFDHWVKLSTLPTWYPDLITDHYIINVLSSLGITWSSPKPWSTHCLSNYTIFRTKSTWCVWCVWFFLSCTVRLGGVRGEVWLLRNPRPWSVHIYLAVHSSSTSTYSHVDFLYTARSNLSRGTRNVNHGHALHEKDSAIYWK